MQVNNRGFLYGDGVFETIKVLNGRPFNLIHHFNRLHKGLRLLALISTEQGFVIEDLLRLLQQQIDDSQQSNLRVRLSFYRVEGGFYSPTQTSFRVHAQWCPLESPYFELNQRGLRMGICSSVKLAQDSLSSLKTISALRYVKAGLEKQENGWDDAVLMNTQQQIAETIAANLFLVKDQIVYTPSLDQACVAGTMRLLILEIMKENDRKVVVQPLCLDDLKQAQGLFLSNAVRGLQWVSEIEGLASYSKDSLFADIVAHLNKKVASN